ncbi:MAG: helix-turn-helix transcriptional regulator [Ruminococcus sp.]|nr:helix-turn-helix transcriptional regulator [Ruminococcus sp.]
MPIKKTLADLRNENNMSQKQLAEKLNISAAAIGMYESGMRTPSLKRAILIANIFNIPVECISFSNTYSKHKKFNIM